MNKYRLRPGYGSKKLLIEFITGPEKKTFLTELEEALLELELVANSTSELWMNDEIRINFESALGPFSLSIDIWDFGFIMPDKNQDLIIKIDLLLQKSPHFIKEIVDFDAYKLEK